MYKSLIRKLKTLQFLVLTLKTSKGHKRIPVRVEVWIQETSGLTSPDKPSCVELRVYTAGSWLHSLGSLLNRQWNTVTHQDFIWITVSSSSILLFNAMSASKGITVSYQIQNQTRECPIINILIQYHRYFVPSDTQIIR